MTKQASRPRKEPPERPAFPIAPERVVLLAAAPMADRAPSPRSEMDSNHYPERAVFFAPTLTSAPPVVWIPRVPLMEDA